MRMEWDERRDYFPATLIAQKANTGRPKHERLVSSDQVLRAKYPELGEGKPEQDPDMGASGGAALKVGLKDATKRAKKLRDKRPRAMI